MMALSRVEARKEKQRQTAEQQQITQLINRDEVRQAHIQALVSTLIGQKPMMTRQAMQKHLSGRTDIRTGIDQRKHARAYVNARVLTATEVTSILERVWGRPTNRKRGK